MTWCGAYHCERGRTIGLWSYADWPLDQCTAAGQGVPAAADNRGRGRGLTAAQQFYALAPSSPHHRGLLIPHRLPAKTCDKTRSLNLSLFVTRKSLLKSWQSPPFSSPPARCFPPAPARPLG